LSGQRTKTQSILRCEDCGAESPCDYEEEEDDEQELA
jgi:hypothetical protein